MEEKVRASGRKILIVDDDLFLLDIYTAVFQEAGFEVMRAKDGFEAWQILEGGYMPDIVFTGIIMPKMTGFDLITKLKGTARYAHLPIAISSHYGQPEHRKRAQELGVDDFIFQAVTTQREVVRRINMLLGEGQNHKISIDIAKSGAEEFITFLDKQRGTFFAQHPEKPLFLEFEPTKEAGQFRVRAVSEEDGS